MTEESVTSLFKKEHETPKKQVVKERVSQLTREIEINVQHIIEANFPPIIARLERIEQLLLGIDMKVDLSAKEEEVLDMLKAAVEKPKK